MFSDNATNFSSAVKQLNLAKSEVVQRFSSQNAIEWRFIPPKASHHGGTWERMIRTIRKVATGVLQNNDRMTDEILSIFFCEVENIVNGRPITKLSDDVRDASPLTPNHLLLLKQNSNEALGLSVPNDVHRTRWRHVQFLANVFWSRWTREYLPILQKRSKWLTTKRNFCVGDLVLMVDENTPRSLWPLGLVIGVNLSRDNLVRSVRLKTKSNELVRPITKIVYLESFGDDL